MDPEPKRWWRECLGIPSVVIADYEHVRHVTHPDWVIVPEVIRTDVARKLAKKVVKYPGIKEDVYVANFQPDPSILAELSLTPSEIIVTVRPPATEAHYHNPESEHLFTAVIDWLCETEGTRTILLPRNDRQKAAIYRRWPAMLQTRKDHYSWPRSGRVELDLAFGLGHQWWRNDEPGGRCTRCSGL